VTHDSDTSRIAITSAADRIAVGSLRTYGQGDTDSGGDCPLPRPDTGERVTPVLDFPLRDGLAVSAIRVDYEPGGFTRGTHRHPAGAYVYVIDGSVVFALNDRDPVVLKAGESFYEPPGALHSVSRNASDDVPASLIGFFVLGEGECATVYDRD
jgi:quercetin dioxygenase-like cupin family protein